jgi:hypothetical protein
MQAGASHSFTMDATTMGLMPGVYFVTAISGSTEMTRQAVLVK